MKRHASRPDSGFHQVKIRVPTDVRDRARGRRFSVTFPATATEPEATLTVTLGDFLKGSLKTRDARTADTRIHLARAALTTFCEALRNGPGPLSQKQVEALAGDVHRHLLAEHGDNPGTPREWESFKALTRAAVEGRIPGAPPIPERGQSDDETMRVLLFGEVEGESLTEAINGMPATWEARALEQRVGRLAYWALQSRGIEVDSETRLRLLRRIAIAALQAGGTLKRMADGDFRPDPLAGRFPAFEAKPAAKVSGVTIAEVFERWKAEVKPAPATVWTWVGIPASLARHLGRQDVVLAELTTADIVGWKDAIVDSGVAASTVNNRYIKCVNVLLNYAVRNGLVQKNVAKDIRVGRRGRVKPGERMRGHTDDDVARLLTIASGETDPVKRWLPWLATLTGARIGELAALWGTSIVEKEGVVGIEIAPSEDGSTLKTESSERWVPLHPTLLEAGFVAFARKRGHAPLFYKGRRSSISRHPAKRVSNALSAWVTAQGFGHERVSPVHGLRHWWKTKAARIGIQDSVADHLQGHALKGVAGLYRDLEDPKFLAEAIARIPVPFMVEGVDDGAMPAEIDPVTETAR